MRLRGTPGKIQGSARTQLGEHTDEVLSGVGIRRRRAQQRAMGTTGIQISCPRIARSKGARLVHHPGGADLRADARASLARM